MGQREHVDRFDRLLERVLEHLADLGVRDRAEHDRVEGDLRQRQRDDLVAHLHAQLARLWLAARRYGERLRGMDAFGAPRPTRGGVLVVAGPLLQLVGQ